MSYLVLARKYRPKTFSEMVGQEHVVQALSNALSSQRLHHAYLFTGTRGVGKTSVSRILAKSLNCLGADGQGGITARPCGECDACTAIDAGCFVDYTELDAASNRGIEDVTTLLEQAVYKPVQGRFKVFMIDEVHMLTGPAFNAMLKTLEEPPAYLKFVLATTDPQKVPATVLSRCLQFNLRPMAPATVRAHLETILSAENIAREPAALALLARSAQGSMRDGLSLTDQAIAFGDGALKEAQVRQMLGAVDEHYIFDFISHLACGAGAAVIAAVQNLQNTGLSAVSTLEQICDVLHRMMVCQMGGASVTALASEVVEDEHKKIESLASKMSTDEIQLLYSICLHGKADLGLASDEYAALTMILLRLLAFQPKKTIDGSAAEPAKKRQVTEEILTSQAGDSLEPVEAAPVPVRIQPEPLAESRTEIRTPSFASPSAVAEFELTPLGDIWFALTQQLMASELIGGLVRELALQSQLIKSEANAWVLQVDNPLLANPAHADKLQAALQTLEPYARLQVQSGNAADSPAKRLAKAASELQLAAETLIMGDAAVQQLMREFDGKIVPRSIKPTTLLTVDTSEEEKNV